MSTAELHDDFLRGLPRVRVTGYLQIEDARELDKKVRAFFLEGKRAWILDLEGCGVINSPAFSVLFELCIWILEEFSGKTFILKPNNLVNLMFVSGGMNQLATMVSSTEEIPS